MAASGAQQSGQSVSGTGRPRRPLRRPLLHAQQAVEKVLKALLVLKGVQVPRTHSISELITLLAELGFDIPVDVQEASALTDYAVAARYPGPSEPVLVED